MTDSRPSDGMMRVYRALRSVRPAPLGALGKRMLRIRRRPVHTEVGAFFIDPASVFGLALLEHGEYEPEMVRVLETCLHRGCTFIDVGANEGYFSVIASKLVGPTGKVYAIEPQARLQDVLSENLRLNDAHNVMLLPYAISNTCGTATIHLTPDTNTGSSSLKRSTRYRLPTQTVETTTLTTLLASHGIVHCDLMKVDIEGHEYEAILGSPDVFLEGRVGALVVDIHYTLLAARAREASNITRALESWGYRSHCRSDGEPLVWRKAVATEAIL